MVHTDHARRNVAFLVAEAYSYGPNVLADLDQAIRAKSNAALKVIYANVPPGGAKSGGVILDENPDLLSFDTSEGSEQSNEDELQQLEEAEKLSEKLSARNGVLEAEVANLTEKLREANREVAQLRARNGVLELEATLLNNAPVEPAENVAELVLAPSAHSQAPADETDDDTVSLLTDAEVLKAIELVPLTTFLGDTNQYMRYKRMSEMAREDGRRAKRFIALGGIVEGIRDGTLDVWVGELRLPTKSAGLFQNFKNFLVSEDRFGDGTGGISIQKIRMGLAPLLRKQGYRVVLPREP
jgi:hypothetical protein